MTGRVVDTRIIHAANDAKAAAAAARDGDVACAKAAMEDSRTALWELLDEGPAMAAGDRCDVYRDYCALGSTLAALKNWPSNVIKSQVIAACDRVYGSLTRLADRWQ